MTNQHMIEQAKVAVGNILTVLNVARVVCVDDTYKDELPVEEVIAAAALLSPTELHGILPELGETVPEDPEIISQRLRVIWNELGKEYREERGEKILVAARLKEPPQETDDIGDASVLHELIPEGRIIRLSPKQWSERREQLMAENAIQRTLFLFDQDLSDAGGDKRGGIKIIASLLAEDRSGSIICGLFTHTVTPEEQPREEMLYFGNSADERWIVKLKQVHQIRSCVLDLCVFNDNGQSAIQIDGDSAQGLRPGWQVRHEKLMKVYSRLLKQLDLLNPIEQESADVKKAKTAIKQAFAGDLLNVGIFKGSVFQNGVQRGIQYNCRRIGRLSRARAFGLLMAYTSCLSRPAFDRDFGMTVLKGRG
jgi:hypothetical protein